MAANDDLKELAEQIMKDKLVLRSKKIQEFLHEKRNLTAYQNGQKKIDLYFAQEEKEEMIKKQEVPAIKGHMGLSKHRKKYKRSKRCWICKSAKHLKRKCPKNRCFSIINMDISRWIAFTEKLTLYFPSFGRITKKEKKEKREDSWKQRKRKSRKKWR